MFPPASERGTAASHLGITRPLRDRPALRTGSRRAIMIRRFTSLYCGSFERRCKAIRGRNPASPSRAGEQVSGKSRPPGARKRLGSPLKNRVLRAPPRMARSGMSVLLFPNMSVPRFSKNMRGRWHRHSCLCTFQRADSASCKPSAYVGKASSTPNSSRSFRLEQR